MGAWKSIVGAAKAPHIAWSFSRRGFQARAKRFDPLPSLEGSSVWLTGANSGIGLAAAKILLDRGARVMMLCRDRRRGEDARDKLAEEVPGAAIDLQIVDMQRLSSVRELATQGANVDVLIHNAGALFQSRETTIEGLERDTALQLAGPHLLTKLLRPALAARSGRVVFVSSGGMYSERLRVDALDWGGRAYDGVAAYARCKRAQVALALEWAQREPRVAFYAMHPGWVDTPGVEQSLPKFHSTVGRWLRTPEQGADTIAWLAGASDLKSGEFYFDRAIARRHILPGTEETEQERKKLWQYLEELTS